MNKESYIKRKDKYVSENDFLQQIVALGVSNKRAFSIALKSLFIGIISLIIEVIFIIYFIVSNV